MVFTLAEPQGGIELNLIKANKAFTLAEVLITLAVIGVVASISIPTLQNNINEQKYKAAYKKGYSAISNAFRQAQAKNELVNRSSNQDGAAHNANFLAIKKYFSVSRECLSNDNRDCWEGQGENINGTPMSTAYAFIDNSGMVWSMRTNGDSYNGYIFLDLNGYKNPNIFGKDRFVFVLVDETYINLSEGSSHSFTGGMPQRVIPMNDQDPGDFWCPTGPCYYRSWLHE